MKHTPGPWHIDPIKVHANGNRRIMAEQCTPVAVVPEHLAADARLIAAAPEMLIALECALRDMENQCHRDGIDPQTDTTCTIVRNTINKATKGA